MNNEEKWSFADIPDTLSLKWMWWKNIREKDVKVSEFSNINVMDGEIIPNQEFSWKISVDEFLSKIYGSEVLDSDRETGVIGIQKSRGYDDYAPDCVSY